MLILKRLRANVDSFIFLKGPQLQAIQQVAADEDHDEEANDFPSDVKNITSKTSEVEIDESLLKVGHKVASGSHGDLYVFFIRFLCCEINLYNTLSNLFD